MTLRISKGLIPFIILALCAACNRAHQTGVSVTNESDFDRLMMVEIPLKTIEPSASGQWIVKDEDGHEIASQVTSDSLLIFQAMLAPKGTSTFWISPGEHAPYDTLATGRIYHERLDDVAWENDNVAFRAYGPALQRNGERGYGYDLFLKHGPTGPVLEQLYARELQPGWHQRVDSLRRAGLTAQADSVAAFHSYHTDSGLGMDPYAVGSTLGAGVAALLDDEGNFSYPWCYQTAEVLEQGPLRFRVFLTFPPRELDGDTITEVRLITLDAGQNLNHTVVKYLGLSKPRTIVSGVPLRDDAPYTANAAEGYISYCDPALAGNNTPEQRGNLFVGLAYPFTPDSAKVVTDAGQPHLVAYTTYQPDSLYVYYWGYGWDLGNIPSYSAFNTLLSHQSLSSRPD